MVNRVVSATDLLAESLKLAQQLAAGPTASFGRIKRMINQSFNNSLVEQLDLEAECQLESGRSNDFREGVQAFFEK
ncbi:enoyl-CoA hydratase-related protein, partial [Escherichia coli]|nr:enoyl-CoA hydratase-related protein [Escherichia coli]